MSSTGESPLKEALGGGWVLSPDAGRWLNALIMTGFAVIWNGFVWAVFFHRPGDLADGLFQLIPLLLFGLIGLVVAALAGYLLLKAAYTPRPMLVLSNPRLIAGGSTTLTWNILGNVSRLANLHIVLVGYEESEYTKGTNTSTDQRDITTIPLWSGSQPAVTGSAQILIPATALPTWRGKKNRLRWKITVKGAVSALPDVNDTFPVEVVPAAPQAGQIVIAGPALGEPNLGITLDAVPTVAGDAYAARVRWQLPTTPRTLGLLLTWEATGKGDTETGIGLKQTFPGEAADALAAAFVLPSLPPRHKGALVSILWTLELVADDKVVHRRKL